MLSKLLYFHLHVCVSTCTYTVANFFAPVVLVCTCFVFFFLYACLFAIYLYMDVSMLRCLLSYSNWIILYFRTRELLWNIYFSIQMQKYCKWISTFQYKCKIIAKFYFPCSSKVLQSEANKMQLHDKDLQSKIYFSR